MPITPNELLKPDQKVCFVMPVHGHDARPLLVEIVKEFPDATFIVVQDGPSSRNYQFTNCKVIQHTKNLGLATSLVDGYEASTHSQADYVVRIDADGEYPVIAVKRLLQALLMTPDAHGGFVDIRRTIHSNGLIDFAFNRVFGLIEGLLIYGRPFGQHSPGLQIYRPQAILGFLNPARKFINRNNLRWGLDILTLKFALRDGRILRLQISPQKWRERRPFMKILMQAISAARVLSLSSEHNA